MLNISYQVKPRTGKIELPENLGFGQIFTDNVFEMDYSPEKGWHNYTIKPLSNLSLHPASMFIHYGQVMFEGMKAFRTVDDEIVLFRPHKHFERLNNSARRLVMPTVDVDMMVEVLKELIAVEKEWMPTKPGESLYIRPYMIGTDSALGVRPSVTYKLIIMLSPVGAYYPEGFKPVKILIQDDYVRAVRKGTGECKTPGNYAASLLGAEIARQQGYTQVLWLDAVELKYIEEVGTMNIFIEYKDEIVTPELTGGILHGVTRASVIEMLKDMGKNISVRRISLEELLRAYDSGKLVSVFGSGTAAVISSVGELKYKDKTLLLNRGENSEIELKLFNEIQSIQYGRIPDRFNWLTKVDVTVPAL